MKKNTDNISFNETIKSSIGSRVKYWRTKNGFSSKELAIKLNISNSGMSKIENDLQLITSQQLIAGCKLGWDADWILTGGSSKDAELTKIINQLTVKQKNAVLQMLQLLSAGT